MRDITLFDIEREADVYLPQVQSTLAKYLSSNLDKNRADAIATAIRIHSDRRQIMMGLANRLKLIPASREQWSDPRAADGVPILARKAISSTKVNHRLHTPFDRTIIESKASYFVGIPPKFTIADDEIKTEKLLEWFNNSGFLFKLNELAQSASSRGTSFVLLSSPPGNKELYATLIDSWSAIIIYNVVTEEPLYGIRYWFNAGSPDGGLDLVAELYDARQKTTYSGSTQTLTIDSKPILHGLYKVPLIEFANSSERIGDVELTTSLQDAFDIADSDLSSEISQLRLAYLALVGDAGGDIDEAWVEQLKQIGVFSMLNGDAKFIEKNLNSGAIEELKRDLESRIYKYSNSYNPDELGSDGAMTAYQIRRKLFRLEASTAESESLFRRSLYNVLSIISKHFALGFDPGDVDITFTRNTPRNVVQDIVDMTRAGFVLSQNRMAALSPLDVNQALNEEELAAEAGSVLINDEGAPISNEQEAGAQIQSANSIVQQVADGTITREAGINQLEIFLGLTSQQAQRIMGSIKPVEKRVEPEVADND